MVLQDAGRVFRILACFACLVLAVPLASGAVSSATIPKSMAPDSADNPGSIASIKNHIAYISEIQDAGMSGTIRYIDTLSRGTGTSDLQQIRDDYLVIAASIPLMQTDSEITKARADLQAQTRLFSEETKAQMATRNGSTAILRNYTRAFTGIAEKELAAENHTLWLVNESARLTLFNRESTSRFLLIRSLGRQGMNMTTAANISERIDAQRPELQLTLTNKSPVAMKTFNEGIRTLNHEFRDQVTSARSARAIELKRDAMMAMV